MGLRTLGKGRHASRDEAGRQHSQSHIIKETKTFTVEESNGNNGSLSADLER